MMSLRQQLHLSKDDETDIPELPFHFGATQEQLDGLDTIVESVQRAHQISNDTALCKLPSSKIYNTILLGTHLAETLQYDLDYYAGSEDETVIAETVRRIQSLVKAVAVGDRENVRRVLGSFQTTAHFATFTDLMYEDHAKDFRDSLAHSLYVVGKHTSPYGGLWAKTEDGQIISFHPDVANENRGTTFESNTLESLNFQISRLDWSDRRDKWIARHSQLALKSQAKKTRPAHIVEHEQSEGSLGAIEGAIELVDWGSRSDSYL